jgi:sigma-54 dependent transcriptional regulator, acetoin dehydrogenase operon transcriptional activator AcoR
MSQSRHGDTVANDRDLAATRVHFLTADTVRASSVRGPILASWQRSRQLKVAADQIELPYIRDPDIDTPLTRSAEPVLRSLREQLDGQPVSVILTDPAGLVLSRLTADPDLERHLDSVLLAPGFSYAEEFVGTNGIGTALEMGAPAHVFGHEHYAENLEELACAGVPIHDPITGRTVGAVDLTCWRRDAGALLLTLAKTTAERIRQALLSEAGVHQLELFTAYLRTCHRMSGIVLALNRDTVMMNDYARSVLDPGDQAALLGRAAEVLSADHRGSGVVGLPSGTAARMFWRPVRDGDRLAGTVVHVKLEDADAAAAPRGREAVARMPLPGLVGSAPVWLRACTDVERVFRSGQWLAVEGEPGVGKLALLKAVQLRRQPVGRFTVLDAADASGDPGWVSTARSTLDDVDSLVIRHVDRLDARRSRALSVALQAGERSRERPLWVAVTLQGAHHPGDDDLGRLLRMFPSTVEVPPLRLHVEDLQDLVPFFLARLGHGGQLVCSQEAMQLLMRSAWPGNIGQLAQILRQVVQHRRAGAIQPDDLPPEVRAVSRRLLSQLESLERDAIVKSLQDAHGQKVQAASSLGMSRATIYRKIREYGIVAPGS